MVSELMLQHGPEWAMKDQLTEAGWSLPRRNQEKWVMTRKIHKIFLSARIVGSSENLVRSSSDAAEKIV